MFCLDDDSAPTHDCQLRIDVKLVGESSVPNLIGAVLFASGLLHLFALFATGSDWSGPLSLRKPALFGISAGVTVWSLIWVLKKLVPRQHDNRLAFFLAGGLLIEVGLITVQQWRGVASHFNRSTPIDAAIESIMLSVVLAVAAGIAWLCWRARWLRPMDDAQAIAIRAGLWLLLISCGIGIGITIAGEWNLAAGRSPEIWGRAGVLKYPHGAVLHALQTLPFLAMLMRKVRVHHPALLMKSAVAAHVLLLGHAVWQTCHGRSRMDLDFTSGICLSASVVLMLIPVGAVIRQLVIHDLVRSRAEHAIRISR